MSNKFATLALGLATALAPATVFASGSVLDEIDAGIYELSTVDSSLVDDMNMLAIGNVITEGRGPAPRPGAGPGPGPRPGYRPVPGPRPVYRPAPRPVYHRSEVVVVRPATTTTVVEETPTTVTPRVGSRFGLGLRVVGSKVADYKLADGDCESYDIAPGIGWYLKFRPSRWVSLEMINDYIFSENEFNERAYRMPFYLGLQFHVFDYGDLDLYGVAAGGATLITYDDGNGPRSDTSVQWGGQFGGGISFLLGIIELGLDVRYTIESAPSDHYYENTYIEYDQDQVVHGVTFAFNIGFGV